MKLLKTTALVLFLSFSTITWSQKTEEAPAVFQQEQQIEKQSRAWWQRLWQKLMCLNLMMNYCTSEHRTSTMNPICTDCMRCLNNVEDCKSF